MQKIRKYISLTLVLILSIVCISCKPVKNKGDSKTVNIIVEKQNTDDMEALQDILKGFKKKYNEYNVNIKETTSIEDMKKYIKEKDGDIIICNRPNFLELHKLGLIKELTSYFENNKLQDDFYNIVSSYGKIGEKFYGMALLPYSLQFIYNENSIKKLVGNNDINTLNDLLILLKNNNINIPVIFPKELNIEMAVSTLIANSIIKENNIVDIYDGEKGIHNNITVINETLNTLNNFKEKNEMNFDLFYYAKKDVLNSLEIGEKPIALVTSLIGVGNEEFKNLSFLAEINKEMIKTTPPIFSNYIVAITDNKLNNISTNKFLDYLLDKDSYMDISNKGYFTGNKIVDSYCKGINKKDAWIIANGGISNIPYYLNLPNDSREILIELIKKSITGEYNKKEIEEKLNYILK